MFQVIEGVVLDGDEKVDFQVGYCFEGLAAVPDLDENVGDDLFGGFADVDVLHAKAEEAVIEMAEQFRKGLFVTITCNLLLPLFDVSTVHTPARRWISLIDSEIGKNTYKKWKKV